MFLVMTVLLLYSSVWNEQFEACVGVYFPAIGTIRAKYVPERQQATIMNIFR